MTPPHGPTMWQCRSLAISRRGNLPEEYEDALATDPPTGRFAIADGAAESLLAGHWARILASSFVENPAPSARDLDDWLVPLQQQWQLEATQRKLPWYAEEKLEEGAFSTFLGLVLQPDGSWRALAVGDSCLFHVRQGKLLTTFPLQHPEAFGRRPWLIGSTSPPGSVTNQAKSQEAHGQWLPGDLIFLTTDALAEWLLRQFLEAGQLPLPVLEQLLTLASQPEPLGAAIDLLQEQQQLANDDCTLLAVTCTPTA